MKIFYQKRNEDLQNVPKRRMMLLKLTSIRYSTEYSIWTRLWAMHLLTNGQSKLIKDRIAAPHGQLNRIRQVAPMWTPSNTCFVGPTRF